MSERKPSGKRTPHGLLKLVAACIPARWMRSGAIVSDLRTAASWRFSTSEHSALVPCPIARRQRGAGTVRAVFPRYQRF